MDEAKIMRALQSMQVKALRAAANVGLAHVLPFVPIDTGALRRSGKVIELDGGVALKFGDEKTQDYVKAQYGQLEGASGKYAKRHHFTGGAMARLLSLISATARRSARGKGNRARYSAAYREAVEEGNLTSFPNGAQWFERILKDVEVQRRMWFAYARALRGVA
jgi:hypothetical protein